MESERFYRIVGKGRSGVDALRSSAGRFHDDASNPTSYTARSLTTAWREVTARLGSVRANPEGFQAFEVIVEEPKLRRLTKDEAARVMKDPAPPEARQLAEELREEGFDGLLYPSIRHAGGECLVLFLENSEPRVDISPITEAERLEFVETT